MRVETPRTLIPTLFLDGDFQVALGFCRRLSGQGALLGLHINGLEHFEVGEQCGFLALVRTSGQKGHPFRSKGATRFGAKGPPVSEQKGHLAEAVEPRPQIAGRDHPRADRMA